MPHRMDDRKLQEILALLEAGDLDQAWPLFLSEFAPVILQVVRLFAKDEDDTSECFLYACEQLNRRKCKRLRRFDPEGSATFSTWLHAVVYNLCRDWRRKKYPRRTTFRWVSRLPTLAQEIFHLHFERGLPIRQTFEDLRAVAPRLSEERVDQIVKELRVHLSARQKWLLQIRRPRVESLEVPYCGEEDGSERAIQDHRQDPEALASRREQEANLHRALGSLSSTDRLILQLRFKDETTLKEIAVLLGLKNAQAVDREVQKIVAVIHQQMK